MPAYTGLVSRCPVTHMRTFCLLPGTMQVITDGNPVPRLPFCCSVHSTVAKGIRTTRISRRKQNLKISPEKVSSWITALKDTSELLWSASFPYYLTLLSQFLYTENILNMLVITQSLFQALSLDTAVISLIAFFLLLQLHQCYPGFPL